MPDYLLLILTNVLPTAQLLANWSTFSGMRQRLKRWQCLL